MIRSFRSRALQRYWERNDARRLPAQDLARIRRILGLLNQAGAPQDLDLPRFHFHPLTGNLHCALCRDRQCELAYNICMEWRRRSRCRLRGLSLMPSKKRRTGPHPDLLPLHPGEVLREDVLPALDLSVAELARSLGITAKLLGDILAERKPVTPEIAIRLGAAFKPSAEMWLRLQAAYDLWHAKRRIDTSSIRPLQAAE